MHGCDCRRQSIWLIAIELNACDAHVDRPTLVASPLLFCLLVSKNGQVCNNYCKIWPLSYLNDFPLVTIRSLLAYKYTELHRTCVKFPANIKKWFASLVPWPPMCQILPWIQKNCRWASASPKIWIVTCLQSTLTSVLDYLDFTIVLDSPVGRIGCFLPLCEFGLVILDACTAKREDVNKVWILIHLNPSLQIQILQVMGWP